MTETLVLQPAEAASQDTTIRQNNKDTAYTDGTILYSRKWDSAGADALIPLIKFDLTGIPAGATIISASLAITRANTSQKTTSPSWRRILPANSGWIEGATWNYANPTSLRWAGDTAGDGSNAGCRVSGTDYSATAIGSFSMTAGAEAAGYSYVSNLDLTEFGYMVSNNCGFILLNTGSGIEQFHSSGATTAAYRPSLTIVYALPTDDLTAADMTLSPVTFDAPILSVASSTDDLTAKDFSLAPVTFDAPVLTATVITPPERTYTVDTEIREYVIPAESREFYIDPDMRGVKIDIDSITKFRNLVSYAGLAGKDMNLAQATFDAPTLYKRPPTVPEPDTALSFVPFYVVDDGDGTFSTINKTVPYSAFDIEASSGITVNKTYYVSMTGSDSNDGLTWETAFRKISKATGKADADRVYIDSGYYGWVDTTPGFNPARSLKMIGVGNVYISESLDYYVGAFSKVSNHYEASYGFASSPKIMDITSTDATGNPLIYTAKTSAVEVDASAGSYFADVAGDVIYVRTFDDRAPDTSLLYIAGSLFLNANKPGINIYLENLNLYTAIDFGNSGGSLYAKDCHIDSCYIFSSGVRTLSSGATVILQNTTITRVNDDNLRNMGGNIALIDCEFSYGGDNSFSSHGGNAVAVNGEFYNVPDRPIHDVNTGKGWYLGVYAHNGGAAVPNFYTSELAGTAFETWCDQCRSSDSGYDYGADLPGRLHKHNCTGDATDTGNGVDTYDY